jgi:ABC-type multidrug transport system permease subunit
VLPFVIANTLSSIPFLFLIALATGTICYFMAGLHPGFSHYVFYIVNIFGCITVVESLMMAIASVVPNFLMGIITGAGVMVMSQVPISAIDPKL